MLLPIHDDDARPLHATVTLDGGPLTWQVTHGSRGGALGSPQERNRGYAEALRKVLGRLGAHGFVLEDAQVASSEAKALSVEERRIATLSYPLELIPATDARSLAGSLQRGQRTVGKAENTRGGNTTKRLLLVVSSATMRTTGEMAELISNAAGMGHVSPERIEVTANSLEEEGSFHADSVAQAQRRVMRAIAVRQGQPAFRRRLLAAYGRRCAISGCSVEALLEAAHIRPYAETQTNHVRNGILLRADLHTLFDWGLLGIDASSWTVVVHPTLNASEYAALHGAEVRLPAEANARPSAEWLARRLREAGLA